MSIFQQNIDIVMCFMWIVIYILVYISMRKLQTIVMPPISCACIFPWEFVAAGRFFFINLTFNYAVIAQFGWALLDALIMYFMLAKLRYYPKKQMWIYLFFVALHTALLIYVFTIQNGMLYATYIGTTLGILYWAIYTAKPDYPRTPLNTIILLLKIIADIFAMIAYCNHNTFILCMSILLPLVDVFHLVVYIVRRPKITVDLAVAVEESLK